MPSLALLVMWHFPWQSVGFAAFERVSHHHVLPGGIALMLPVVARALGYLHVPARLRRHPEWRPAGAVALALAIAPLVFFKAYDAANFLYHSGQSQYHSMATLRQTDWQPKEPLRVVTVRTPDIGPEPPLAGSGFYGLHALDFYLTLKPKQFEDYWKAAIPGGGPGQDVYIDWSRWDGEQYHLEDLLPLPLLRWASVGFVISALPCIGDNVTLVAGPPQRPMTRTDIRAAPMRFLWERIVRIFDFNDPYVYALRDPLPLVFAAGKLKEVESTESAEALIRQIPQELDSPVRQIIVERAAAKALGAASPSLRVQGVTEVRDGYDVRVDAPEGGILVLNTPWMPFWKAYADDGANLQPVEANWIHLAVAVPVGAHAVSFRYHRPTIGEAIRKVLGATSG